MILYKDDSGYPPLTCWIMKIKAEITAIPRIILIC